MSLNLTNKQASFLPEDYIRGKDEARWNVISLLLFGVVMVAVVSAFVLTNRRWQQVRVEQETIGAQFKEEAIKIAALEEIETQRVEMMDKASIVAALRDRVPRSLLLAELWRAKPDSATLTTVELEGERVKPPKPATSTGSQGAVASLRGKKSTPVEGDAKDTEHVAPPEFRHSLTIEGVAEENDQIADYLANLKDSPLLLDVELQFINETVLEKQQFRKFKITARLNPAANASDVDQAEETKLFDESASTGPNAMGSFLSSFLKTGGNDE